MGSGIHLALWPARTAPSWALGEAEHAGWFTQGDDEFLGLAELEGWHLGSQVRILMDRCAWRAGPD